MQWYYSTTKTKTTMKNHDEMVSQAVDVKTMTVVVSGGCWQKDLSRRGHYVIENEMTSVPNQAVRQVYAQIHFLG